jgi:hypothetical protein
LTSVLYKLLLDLELGLGGPQPEEGGINSEPRSKRSMICKEDSSPWLEVSLDKCTGSTSKRSKHSLDAAKEKSDKELEKTSGERKESKKCRKTSKLEIQGRQSCQREDPKVIVKKKPTRR